MPCCLLSHFSRFFHTASCGKKVQISPSRELKSEPLAEADFCSILYRSIPTFSILFRCFLSHNALLPTMRHWHCQICSFSFKVQQSLLASEQGLGSKHFRLESGDLMDDSSFIAIRGKYMEIWVIFQCHHSASSMFASRSSTQFALSLFSRSLPVCKRAKLLVMWWLSMQRSVHWIVVRSGRRPSQQNVCRVTGSAAVGLLFRH